MLDRGDGRGGGGGRKAGILRIVMECYHDVG